MSQGRQNNRINCNANVTVFDQIDRDVVGQLVNISENGFMMLSNSELPENHLFQFELQLPETVAGQSTISVGVESLWKQQIPGVAQYWMGFQIIDMTDATEAIILELIALWRHQ